MMKIKTIVLWITRVWQAMLIICPNRTSLLLMNFFTSIIRKIQKSCPSNQVSKCVHKRTCLIFYNSALILEVLLGAHLSKGQTDLKQKGTQKKKLFYGSIFHAPSHGVNRSVASDCFKNYKMEAWEHFILSQGFFWSQHSKQNASHGSYHMKGHEKLDHKIVVRNYLIEVLLLAMAKKVTSNGAQIKLC